MDRGLIMQQNDLVAERFLANVRRGFTSGRFWLMSGTGPIWRPAKPQIRGLCARDFRAAGALSLTFALNSHFRSSSRRILFAFNVAVAETGQVKTLPLF
jgi:hypothetical protein